MLRRAVLLHHAVLRPKPVELACLLACLLASTFYTHAIPTLCCAVLLHAVLRPSQHHRSLLLPSHALVCCVELSQCLQQAIALVLAQ